MRPRSTPRVLMRQNAWQNVFPLTRQYRVGTLLMFAVRNIFSQPGRLQRTMRELAAAGLVPQAFADSPDPLGFLVHEGGASSVIDAAYRFVRHEPGVDVVRFGTGDHEHLKSNIGSLVKPRLPVSDRGKLAELFGHLVGSASTPVSQPRRTRGQPLIAALSEGARVVRTASRKCRRAWE